MLFPQQRDRAEGQLTPGISQLWEAFQVILDPAEMDALLCIVCLSKCSSQQWRQVHSFLMLRDLIFLIIFPANA